MALPSETAWTTAQANTWLQMQMQTPFHDAALVDYMKPRLDETGVLDIGCADGSLAFAIYKVLLAQTAASGPQDLPEIVGIDNCQHMIDRANTQLDSVAAMEGPAGIVRDHVSFENMDFMHFGDPKVSSALLSRFPNGISTIIACGVLDEICSRATRQVVRNLMVLLNRGGRIVFTTCPTPQAWTSVYLFNPPTRSLRAALDIAPPAFIRWAEQQVLNACQNIGGPGLIIGDPACRWLALVWQSFAARTTQDGPGMAHINSQAMLHPTQGVLYHTASPPVRCCSSSATWVRCAVIDYLGTISGPRAPGVVQEMVGEALNGCGTIALQARLAEAYGTSNTRDAVMQSIQDNSRFLFAPHCINFRNTPCEVGAGFVLGTIRRW